MAVTFAGDTITPGVNIAAILKVLCPQKRVENQVYADHAFLAMVKKNEQFFGSHLAVAVRYGDSQGRSAAFGTAQTNNGSFAAKKFMLTRVADYQVCRLDTESIMASENDQGALIQALDTELSSGMNNIGKSLATSLVRGKSGALAQIGSVASDTITLKNINDITSFEVGMVLGTPYTAKSGGSAHATPASSTIVAVDRDAGTITMTTNDLSGTNWVADDYLFPAGDRGVKISGLDDWFPSSAPTAGDAHFGVDRSSDTVRLAGLRVDLSGLNPEEGLVTALSRVHREGGRPNMVFLNHLDFRNVEISLGSKVEYESLSVGDIGFQALTVNSAKGKVSLLADQDIPAGVGYALDMRTLTLHSLKKAPQILELDGNKLMRVYNADQWEARIAYFAQLGCDAPGWNCRMVMP